MTDFAYSPMFSQAADDTAYELVSTEQRGVWIVTFPSLGPQIPRKTHSICSNNDATVEQISLLGFNKYLEF